MLCVSSGSDRTNAQRHYYISGARTAHAVVVTTNKPRRIVVRDPYGERCEAAWAATTGKRLIQARLHEAHSHTEKKAPQGGETLQGL
jgi:hypothetical protein